MPERFPQAWAVMCAFNDVEHLQLAAGADMSAVPAHGFDQPLRRVGTAPDEEWLL
jgi:hypothetical protein